VGLAVVGSVLVTAGLAAWLLSAVSGVVPDSAAGITRLAGLSLAVAGALCGLAMIIIILGVGRGPQTADLPAATDEPDGEAGRATTAPVQATSTAPGPLPERVSLAERPPSWLDAEPPPHSPDEPAAEPPPQPARQWSPETVPERFPEPAPEWAHVPVPEPPLPPAPQWTPEPGPEPQPQPAARWTPEPLPERAPDPAPEWAHEPAPEWAHEPAAEWAHEPAAEWAHEPAAEWAPGPAPVPTADPLAGSSVPAPEATSDEQPAEPASTRWRPARKPTAGWNPDSEEDWLRVLRGLRGSVQSPADQHISDED
jgi:hypothetical protein